MNEDFEFTSRSAVTLPLTSNKAIMYIKNAIFRRFKSFQYRFLG